MSGLPSSVAVLSVMVLLIGAMLGAVSRLILGRRSSVTLAGSILAGILGSVIGGVIAQAVAGNPDDPRGGPVVLSSVVGTVAVLLVAERFVRRPPPSAPELIQSGESAQVEFKSTARHNVRSGQRDDRIEAAIARTVAGFLNASGGTLMIGVDDTGRPLGLEHDLAHMKEPNLDQYELWVHDYLARTLGLPAVAMVRVSFPVVEGKTLCRIDVDASPRPVFLRPAKGAEVQFHARLGNSTRTLGVAEAIEYAADHFHRRQWQRPGRRRLRREPPDR